MMRYIRQNFSILMIISLILINISAAAFLIVTRRNDSKFSAQQDKQEDEIKNYEEIIDPEKQYKIYPGKLFLVGIPDKVLSESTIQYLKENHICGVVLLGSNIENETQLRKLTSDLKEKVDPNLIIAIDQEGGLVTRIKWDKYANVSFREIGQKNDLKYTYEVAKYRADLLMSLGINTILGPVADVAYDKSSFLYSRSFGSDPNIVAKHVAETVRAQKDAGIITVLKHFPGHGPTSTDSHENLPVISKSIEQLNSSDFIPFQAGIDNGAEMIMTGHIINPQIDPEVPSSLSPKYVDILKKELNFQGIIITDDLKMTGKLEGGVGWGLNISIEENSKTLKRIKSVTVDEDEYDKIMELLSNLGD